MTRLLSVPLDLDDEEGSVPCSYLQFLFPFFDLGNESEFLKVLSLLWFGLGTLLYSLDLGTSEDVVKGKS
ncbi:unnamed protein product [Allacma fusca]|uniref:Uncharacterized protein n=1 Tax=Allacma fusca TaxID=39272 RepID=A0A8J2LF16_9HEXA|nr:unnamed protein product [Allacma fusca]